MRYYRSDQLRFVQRTIEKNPEEQPKIKVKGGSAETNWLNLSANELIQLIGMIKAREKNEDVGLETDLPLRVSVAFKGIQFIQDKTAGITYTNNKVDVQKLTMIRQSRGDTDMLAMIDTPPDKTIRIVVMGGVFAFTYE